MAFAFIGGYSTSGQLGTATVTHGLTIGAGQLLIMYINRDVATTINLPTGGTTWLSAFQENAPDPESAKHAVFWKITGASEPTSYSVGLNGTNDFHVTLHQFSYTNTPVIKLAANATINAVSTTSLQCTAADGRTVAAGDLSFIGATKDRGTTGKTWSAVDNGFLGIQGAGENRELASAYKIHGSGETLGTPITFTDSGTGGTADLSYGVHIVFEESTPDVTAPVISSPTGTKTGHNTASGTVSTDEDNGTLYYYASTNASETAATIKASGSSQAVSTTGVQNVSFTGLAPATGLYAHYVHDDAASNESNVVSSTQFTTDPAPRGITNFDGDNDVQAGQTGVVITTTALDASPVTQTATLGGETLTITNWTSTAVTVTIPANINLKWGRTDLQLALTDDTGIVTLDNVTLSPEAGWEFVTYNGSAPDINTTESFVEHAAADTDINGGAGIAMAANDLLAWQSVTGLSVDNQTLPTVSPPANVASNYKVWDDSLNTWTVQSTFVLTDAGYITAATSVLVNGNVYIKSNDGKIYGKYPLGDQGPQLGGDIDLAIGPALDYIPTGSNAYTFGKPVVAANNHWILVGTAGSDHVAADNRIIIMRSTDNGETWTDPVDIFKDADADTATRQFALFRDPVTDDLISFCGVLPVPFNPFTQGYYKVYTLRSTDNGVTWAPNDVTAQMPDAVHGPDKMFPHGSAVQTDNGLAICVYSADDVKLVFSTDNGVTWGNVADAGDVPDEGQFGTATEPEIVAVTTSNLVMICRDNERAGQKAYKKSTNGGLSFSARSSYTTVGESGCTVDQPVGMKLIGSDVYFIFPCRLPTGKLITNKMDKDAFWADPSLIWNPSSPNRQTPYTSNTIATNDYIDFGNAYIAEIPTSPGEAFIAFFDHAPYPANPLHTVLLNTGSFPD